MFERVGANEFENKNFLNEAGLLSNRLPKNPNRLLDGTQFI